MYQGKLYYFSFHCFYEILASFLEILLVLVCESRVLDGWVTPSQNTDYASS